MPAILHSELTPPPLRADTESDTAIPLPNVESPILSKVIEYCTWHVKAEADRTPEDARNEWNQKFVDVDQGTLFHLILVRTSFVCRRTGGVGPADAGRLVEI